MFSPTIVSERVFLLHHELILILDFGSQYTQLIARRIREQGVYCEIHPFNLPVEKIRTMAPKGIILSGGPSSVTDEDAPRVSADFYSNLITLRCSAFVTECRCFP